MNRYLVSALTIIPVLPVFAPLVPGGAKWYHDQLNERDFEAPIAGPIRGFGSFLSGLTLGLTFRPETARKQWFADIDRISGDLDDLTPGQKALHYGAKFLAGSLAWLATAFSATVAIIFTVGAVSAAGLSFGSGLQAVTNLLGNIGNFFTNIGNAFNVFASPSVWVPTLVSSVVAGIAGMVGYNVYQEDYKAYKSTSRSNSSSRRSSVSSTTTTDSADSTPQLSRSPKQQGKGGTYAQVPGTDSDSDSGEGMGDPYALATRSRVTPGANEATGSGSGTGVPRRHGFGQGAKKDSESNNKGGDQKHGKKTRRPNPFDNR